MSKLGRSSSVIILAAASIASAAPAYAASECGQQIQAIERRMHSAGASEVTGKPMSPDAKAQASNAAGHAPAPDNAHQKPTKQKMADAEKLIDKAKQQDKAGQKEECEKTMMNAQALLGALP